MDQHHLELRGRIRAKGLTVTELARKVGLSGSYVSNILCGRYSPDIQICYDILKAIDAEPSEIVTLFPPV